MIARLSDPWFEAKFTTNTTATGHTHHASIDGADGLWLWCPCGYGKPEYPLDGARPHGVFVSFANPRNAPQVPPDAGSHARDGSPSRWAMTGTSFDDLTLTPSIDLCDGKTPACWHGYITNGEVL